MRNKSKISFICRRAFVSHDLQCRNGLGIFFYFTSIVINTLAMRNSYKFSTTATRHKVEEGIEKVSSNKSVIKKVSIIRALRSRKGMNVIDVFYFSTIERGKLFENQVLFSRWRIQLDTFFRVMNTIGKYTGNLLVAIFFRWVRNVSCEL